MNSKTGKGTVAFYLTGFEILCMTGIYFSPNIKLTILLSIIAITIIIVFGRSKKLFQALSN